MPDTPKKADPTSAGFRPPVSCHRCGVDVHPLAGFPDDNDHTVCLSCYEQTARARRPMNGAESYVVVMAGTEYRRRKDGAPISLGEAWSETYGVGECSIYGASGRLVLHNAGSVSRRAQVRRWHGVAPKLSTGAPFTCVGWFTVDVAELAR